jgi:CubicO group peptidase (beta-lactamase class C family)
MTKKILLWVVGVTLTVTLQAQIYPGTDWKKANPATHGFDSKKLDEVRRFVIDSMYTTGLMVVVGGESIFEYGSLTRLSYLASVRKSVLAMMYGKYVENGTIDLSLTLAQLGIDDIGGLLPIEKQATVKHVISARSGVYHDASNGGDDADLRPARGSKKPGEAYLYNNWDFNVAGAIFEQLVGRNIYEVFLDDIAIPIGMQDYDLKNQRKTGDLAASKYLAYHFHFSTRDMARIGYLMLRNGKWQNQQVIPVAWIKESTYPHTTKQEMILTRPNRYMFDYGYMWWLFNQDDVPALKGAYTGTGLLGQYITIVPELDMVIAHKTDNTYSGRRTSFEQYYKLLRMLIDAKI